MEKQVNEILKTIDELRVYSNSISIKKGGDSYMEIPGSITIKLNFFETDYERVESIRSRLDKFDEYWKKTQIDGDCNYSHKYDWSPRFQNLNTIGNNPRDLGRTYLDGHAIFTFRDSNQDQFEDWFRYKKEKRFFEIVTNAIDNKLN
jgi:hypothetical protein